MASRPGHERHTVYLGRLGKPVPKQRHMPMARALQGTPGTTVSVI